MAHLLDLENYSLDHFQASIAMYFSILKIQLGEIMQRLYDFLFFTHWISPCYLLIFPKLALMYGVGNCNY
jgi:hypothetical protein